MAICIRHWEPSGPFTVTVIDASYSDIGEKVVLHVDTHGGTSISNLILPQVDQNHVAGGGG